MYRDVPVYIQFYPTLKCDLACSFCFNRGIAPKVEMSIPDFEKMVSVISGWGISEMDLLGGEPTLHPRFSDMVDVLHANGMRTTVSTNGHRSVPVLESLHRKYGGGFPRVGISLNTRVISRKLRDYILTCRPVVKSVCTRKTIIPEAGRHYLSRPGIEYYLIFMDTVNETDLKTSLPFYEFLRELKMLRAVHENVKGVFCSGFVPDPGNEAVLRYARCPAGTTKLSVMPDGSVYPCYLFFRNEGFRLGNLLFDDFDAIWRSPRLDSFREFRGNTCRHTGCEIFSDCHGGCPAVSFLIRGDISAPDPRCERIW